MVKRAGTERFLRSVKKAKEPAFEGKMSRITCSDLFFLVISTDV